MKITKKLVIDYLYILAGSFILAFAVSVFLVPCKISTGGVSGVATVLYYSFGIPLSITTLVINLVLFVLGYKTLPRASLVKTLAGILFFSLSLELTDLIAVWCSSAVGEITSDVWISAVFGGVLVGAGVGLVVCKEASTGGSDFAALMLNKLIPHVPVATFIMLIDSAVIIVSCIVFGDYSIMFYSVASLYISTKVTDFIMVGGDKARSVYIISDANERIAEEIMQRLERGVTSIHSYGCYGKTDREMLMCIVKPKEVPKVLSITHEIDPAAFTVVSEVKEVRGLGFKEDDYLKATNTNNTDNVSEKEN